MTTPSPAAPPGTTPTEENPFHEAVSNATTYADAVQTNRKLIPGLQSPFPMINYTSSMLIEDPVAQMICASLDEVLAPIISVLDCYDAYLDAHVAPLDFVRYMCSWILVSPELGWSESVVRNALSHAITFYGLRGTSVGLERFFAAVLQLNVTVEESGSVTTSRDSTDPSTWPVPAPPNATITIHGQEGVPVDLNFVNLVLNTALPAHVDARLVEAT